MFQVWLLSKQAIVHSREITIKEKEKGENKQNTNPRTGHLSPQQLPTKQRGVWICAQGVVETVAALVKYKYGALCQVCPGLCLLLWFYRLVWHGYSSAWSSEYVCFYFFIFTRSVHLLASKCYLVDSSLKLVTEFVFNFLSFLYCKGKYICSISYACRAVTTTPESFRSQNT